jgi:hypothetical protein
MLSHHRNREGPVIVADDERRLVVAVLGNGVLGVISRHEFVARHLIGNRVAGADDLLSLRTQHCQELFLVLRLGGVDQRSDCVVSGLEALFRVGGSETNDKRRAENKQA